MKDEYIRKQDAVEALDELRINSLDAEKGLLLLSGIAAASDIIESLEPADVVQVVRCKDCLFFTTEKSCCRSEGLIKAREDDFCSYGERREG